MLFDTRHCGSIGRYNVPLRLGYKASKFTYHVYYALIKSENPTFKVVTKEVLGYP